MWHCSLRNTSPYLGFPSTSVSVRCFFRSTQLISISRSLGLMLSMLERKRKMWKKPHDTRKTFGHQLENKTTLVNFFQLSQLSYEGLMTDSDLSLPAESSRNQSNQSVHMWTCVTALLFIWWCPHKCVAVYFCFVLCNQWRNSFWLLHWMAP